MAHHTFDISKLERLNDPGRLETIQPTVMWAALGNPNPRVIVEIGAGTGLFAAAFAELAPASTVYAADSEPRMIDWMREHRPEVDLGRVIPVASTETSVPLDDRVADVLAMINVHHELADPDAIYAEALRLLAPGGKLLVVDWAPRDTPKGPPLAVRATADQLHRFLERVGFEQIEEHENALAWHTVVTASRSS